MINNSKNIKNQINIDAIAGVERLSDQSSERFSGGEARVELYADYGGKNKIGFISIQDGQSTNLVGAYKGRISSIKVNKLSKGQILNLATAIFRRGG